MGSNRPKQFLQLGDQPVLAHSAATLAEVLRQAVRATAESACFCAVAPHPYIEETRQILEQNLARAPAHASSMPVPELDLEVVVGGADRHKSTLAGLRAVLAKTTERPGSDVVLVHDAARPLIDAAEVERLVRVFADLDVVVASLASALTETIVRADALPGTVSACVDRSEFAAVKTPQALRLDVARELIQRTDRGEFSGAERGFTDLLTWAAAAGLPAQLVPAGLRNLKLTHPADLPWLESLLDRS